MARRSSRPELEFRPKPKLVAADFELPEPKPSRRPWAAIAIFWGIAVVAAIALRDGEPPLESWIDGVMPPEPSGQAAPTERRPRVFRGAPVAAELPKSVVHAERRSVREEPVTEARGTAQSADTPAAALGDPTPAPERSVSVRPEGRPRALPRGMVAVGYVTPGRPYGGERPTVDHVEEIDRPESDLDDSVLEEDDPHRRAR